jgi:hypothetical protein
MALAHKIEALKSFLTGRPYVKTSLRPKKHEGPPLTK